MAAKTKNNKPKGNNTMPNANDMTRAQMVKLVPCIAKMSADEQTAMGFNPEAVKTVAATMDGTTTPTPGQAGGYPDNTGKSPNYTLAPWSVVADKGVKRFYSILASLEGFSTTFSKEFQVVGNPNVLPQMSVPIYDSVGKAAVDDYSNYDNRRSGTVNYTSVSLHKVDEVVEVFAGDITAGIDIVPLVEGAIFRVAERVQELVFNGIAVGATEEKARAGENSPRAVTALEIKSVEDGFSFGYANKVLSEAIQPRVDALLLSSDYYGALKSENRDSLRPSDLDVGLVQKVQGLEELGDDCVGLLANKRGCAVGMKAPYFLQGAYASHQQLQKQDGTNTPISIVTYYQPGLNCLKIVVATMVGVRVTDVTAIKPLVPATAASSAA